MTRHCNFGGNLTWESRSYRPRSEQEVLEILQRHRQGQVRAMGTKHSWSGIAVSSDASVDMGGFSDVEPFEADGEKRVRVGAGCTLQSLLDRLHATTDQTLPTLGVIKLQSISGAISTGTHGSGRQGLSHFVVGVRVAAYDPATGQPQIFDYRGGDELKASRCGLGCTGVILSVELRTVAKYKVEEAIVRHPSLESVLHRYTDWPLTQFALIPYCWQYVAFERKPIPERVLSNEEALRAWWLRLYNKWGVDVAFHGILTLVLMAGDEAVRGFLRLVPGLLRGRRIDDAEQVLTTGQHRYRHEEMELFVPESKLPQAMEMIRCATQVFAGDDVPVSGEIQSKLDGLGLYDELVRNRGTYTHHYPFFIRRVLPEDALVSMASGAAEPYYSVSVFTYDRPGSREIYYMFCNWLARSMGRSFNARPHWGKHFPLGAADVARLYPDLETFRRLCAATDPNGVFRNPFIERALGPVVVARPARAM